MLYIRKSICLCLHERTVLDHRNRYGGNMLCLHPPLDDIIDVLRANSDCGDKNACKWKKKAVTIHLSLRTVGDIALNVCPCRAAGYWSGPL